MNRSKRLKGYLLSEVFKENTSLKYCQLKIAAQKFLGDEFSEGVLNGVLYKSVANNNLKKVGHGEYMLVETSTNDEDDVIEVNIDTAKAEDINNLISKSFKEAIEKIQHGLADVDFLLLSDEDFKLVKNVRDTISDLNEKFDLNL